MAVSQTPRQPTAIIPSAEEIKNKRLSEENLKKATDALAKDGIVVVEDAIPHEDLDHLNAKMIKDSVLLQSRGEDSPFNYNKGNLQQDAPPYAEYFHPSIFCNPIATQITSAILGPRPKWTFASGNAAMPPLPGQENERQPVHNDVEFPHPPKCFALVTNVPLIGMNPDNGSTETWLGTHNRTIPKEGGQKGQRATGHIPQDKLEEQVAVAGPPVQPTLKKGSFAIRDFTIWHAGMPNKTQDIRIMLAQIHFASWFPNPTRLELAEDIKPILEELEAKGELGLEVPVNWVTKEQAQTTYLDRALGKKYKTNKTDEE
ncbi:hypothetical protein FHL15_006405 [Xylaria flabelliformis]|uniref:Phytanoyl-CoA dioxygenase n=1 Tax=Xylaria flabelliformis TaxID=2512241 RepID=A0A553HXR0_9PEZI|nr:hypothetical protein FHL15_006405 [Xylaria flabelliformis]